MRASNSYRFGIFAQIMGRAAVLPIGSNPEFDDSYSPRALALILAHTSHLLGDIAIHSNCCDA